MDDTITEYWIQHLYKSTAKDLYNLALNVYGNETEALTASSDAFIDAFIKATGKKNVQDADLFKRLSIRYLYVSGKRRNLVRRWQNKTLIFNRELQAALAEDGGKTLGKLNLLNYNERFILLLFCCQKMNIKHISQVLKLPVFFVTRRLLSAVHKLAFFSEKAA